MYEFALPPGAEPTMAEKFRRADVVMSGSRGRSKAARSGSRRRDGGGSAANVPYPHLTTRRASCRSGGGGCDIECFKGCRR